MTAPYKIHVKLGQFEFEAEGPEEVVREQFALFLDIARSPASVAAAPQASPSAGGAPAASSGSGNGGQDVSRELLDRIFLMDSDGQVSLRVLPRSQQREADGLLALLYGFRVLGNQMDVLSGRLLQAATTSGLSIDRVDRAMYPHLELITKGGTRSGSRWGLNNRGVARAEEILHAMVN